MAIANAVNAQTAGFQSMTSGGVWNGRTFTAGSGITITNGDGVSGNPVISASPTPGNLGMVYIYEDFLGYKQGAGGSGGGGLGNNHLTYALQGGSSSLTSTTGTASNPGVLLFSVSAGSNPDVIQIYANSNIDSFKIGNGELQISWIFKLNQLSTGTQRFKVRCGLMDIYPAITTVSNGCWFEYVDNVNSGNWTINCANGGATTTANTSTAAETTSYHNYKVIVNAAGTSASFYYDGVQVANSPIATNLPTNGLTFNYRMEKTVGSNAVTSSLDMMLFQYTLITPRPG